MADLEAKGEQLRAEKENLETQLAARHADLYTDEVRAHDTAKVELANKLKGKYYTIAFEDKCDRSIRFVLKFSALDNEREVSGWYVVDPGETLNAAETQNVNFAFFAYTDDSKFSWQGDEEVKVSDDQFEYIENAEFRAGWYPSTNIENKYNFQHVVIDPKLVHLGTFTTDFDCISSQTAK